MRNSFVVALVCLGGCHSNSPRQDLEIEFKELRFAVAPTIHYQIKANEITIWDEVKSAGYMKVTKSEIPAEQGEMPDAVERIFLYQAQYLDKTLINEKFLGPPVLIKNRKMDHYGASWRLPDGTMYVLTLSFQQRNLFRFLLRLAPPQSLGKYQDRRENIVKALEGASFAR